MTVNSKRKGKTGELEASSELRRLFNVEARRGQQHQGGPDSPDIVTSIPGVHFEVSRAESLRLWEKVEQAVGDAGDNVPVVLHRGNRRPWLAIVRLDDLPELVWRLYLTLVEGA